MHRGAIRRESASVEDGDEPLPTTKILLVGGYGVKFYIFRESSLYNLVKSSNISTEQIISIICQPVKKSYTTQPGILHHEMLASLGAGVYLSIRS